MTARCLAGLAFILAVVVLQGCGRHPTAPERVCGWHTAHGPVLNAQGDTVAVMTFRQYACR